MPGSRLTLHDREVIARGIDAGWTLTAMATAVGKHRTTVSREIARGSGFQASQPSKGDPLRPGRRRRPKYKPAVADLRSRQRARRPKSLKITGELAQIVTGMLEMDWSPQQVSAVLAITFPDDEAMQVSHETIYRSLFVQTRGELRRELTEHLRTGRTSRRPHGNGRRVRGITGTVHISQRPAEADDRAVPGHWEGDLLMGGTGKGAVITLVERHSRFALLAPLPGTHTSLDLHATLTPLIASLPASLRRSLTWDNGSEMAGHVQIAVDADIDIYFCDPHSPWQRGSNENTNGLLRQYWPKGADMRNLTQADCDRVADLLNTRPRQTLAWKTPQQALDEALRATAA